MATYVWLINIMSDSYLKSRRTSYHSVTVLLFNVSQNCVMSHLQNISGACTCMSCKFNKNFLFVNFHSLTDNVRLLSF